MENHHVEWVNQRTKWPFSIAMFLYQRVYYIYILYILVGGFNPSEKYESQWEGLFLIYYGKIKFMFQTTNQIRFLTH
jgi:hypothetical protein